MRTHLNKSRSLLFWPICGLVAAIFAPLAGAQVVNVYSHRHYEVDKQLNDLFRQKTGIEVKLVNAEADQLIERMKSEGAACPADVLVTVDAGRMQRAKADGLLQPMESEIARKLVPAGLADADGHWVPYTVRARVILAAKDRVAEGEIKTYEDLADPKWRGRLLVRSSSSSYNQSLLASIVAARGEAAAEAWARGVVSNFARPPQGGDRDQIKAVASGLADVCISNSYYLGLLLASPDPAERAAGESMRVIFPNQEDRGAHCNVSAIGVAKHAPNVSAARAYIEFLLGPEAQKMLANGSHEHPVNLDLTLSPLLEKWGSFKADTTTFSKLGENQPSAIRIFDAAGWK
jgi:iron(III) transport system substrate-binding protein